MGWPLLFKESVEIKIIPLQKEAFMTKQDHRFWLLEEQKAHKIGLVMPVLKE